MRDEPGRPIREAWRQDRHIRICVAPEVHRLVDSIICLHYPSLYQFTFKTNIELIALGDPKVSFHRPQGIAGTREANLRKTGCRVAGADRHYARTGCGSEGLELGGTCIGARKLI